MRLGQSLADLQQQILETSILLLQPALQTAQTDMQHVGNHFLFGDICLSDLTMCMRPRTGG